MGTRKKILSMLLAICMVLGTMPAVAFAAETTDKWDGSVATEFAGGDGTADSPYQIATGAQLAYLAGIVNSGEKGEKCAGKYYVLTEDIDLNNQQWTPIGNTFANVLFGDSDYVYFAGSFDGKNHTISNLAIGSAEKPSEADVCGLFGAFAGTIANVNLNNVSINVVAAKMSRGAVGMFGSLAGYAGGKISDCTVSNVDINADTPEEGQVAAYWNGGFAGIIDESSSVANCRVTGTIKEKSGKGSAGGFIGELGEASTIEYCGADVAVTSIKNFYGGADLGGFIGKGNGNRNEKTLIKNCYAKGNVFGGAYAGGFTGSLSGLNIKNCYATGNVIDVNNSAASFAGTDGSGYNYYGSVTNCYSTGVVSGNSAYIYAFAHKDGTQRSEFTNCYYNSENESIKNNYEKVVAKSLEEIRTENFAAALNADDASNGWIYREGAAPYCGAEPADYSAVDAALAKVPADLSGYTEETVNALKAVKEAVSRSRNITQQSEVDSYVKAVEDAVAALKEKQTSGGGYIPPVTDNVINTPENKDTNQEPKTDANINASTTVNDGKTEAKAGVDADTADKIINKALENKSQEIIVEAKSENSSVTKSEVSIPEKAVKEISEKTEAGITVKSDVADVTLDKAAVDAVAANAGEAGTVSLIVEIVKQDSNIHQVELKLVTSEGTVIDFKGGNVSVTVKPAKELYSKDLVCVYIDDDGVYHKIDGTKNEDGTFTFRTGHFSAYALLPADEAAKLFNRQDAQKATELAKALKLKARSVKTEKGNIKISLTVTKGDVKAIKELGYTVKYKFYRSTSKASKYAEKVEKSQKTYINTTGQKGSRYYYKARVMVYDPQGELVTKTELKQCLYAVRIK